MADTKKPFEEVSMEDAEAMFANAARAMGGNRGRSEGFRRVSIPVSEPVRPAPLPKEEPEKKAFVLAPDAIEPKKESNAGSGKLQSERKAKYLRKRKREEDESVPISKEKLAARQEARLAAEAVAPVVEEEPEDIRIYEAPETDDYDEPERGFDFGATTIIPSAVTFDYGDEYDEEEYDEDYEYSEADIEEEVAFSALEQALNRHKEVYGDTRKGRRNRYHDYGFGMGISFDGPDYDDED